MTIPELIAKWRAEADDGWDRCTLSPDAIGLLRRCADELEAAERGQDDAGKK